MNGKIESFLEKKTAVYLDTSPVIYFLQANPTYFPIVQQVFSRIERGIVRGFSSYITLIEVLIKPLEEKAYRLARQYRDVLIGSPRFDLYPVDRQVAQSAAELRAKYGKSTLPMADAIQIATAVVFGAQLFITNDLKLTKVKEVEILALDNLSRA